MWKAIKASGNTAGKAWWLCVTIHLPERCTSGTEFIKPEHWLSHINLPGAFLAWPSNNCFCSLKQWNILVQGLNLKWDGRPSEQYATCFAPMCFLRRERFSVSEVWYLLGNLWRNYQSSWLDSSSSQERSCSVETKTIAGMITNHSEADSCLLHSSFPYKPAFLCSFPEWSYFLHSFYLSKAVKASRFL